jgi:hypothetical protein
LVEERLIQLGLVAAGVIDVVAGVEVAACKATLGKEARA